MSKSSVLTGTLVGKEKMHDLEKQNAEIDKMIQTYTENLKRIIKYESIAKQAVVNLKKKLVEAEKKLNDKRIEKRKCSQERGEFIEKKMNVMKLMYACEISDDEDEKTSLIAKEMEDKPLIIIGEDKQLIANKKKKKTSDWVKKKKKREKGKEI
eukprot:493723_1